MGAGLQRVLIANRGEIAVRIARACRELGIEAVAAYEPAERGALHVEVADAAVEVAGYLDADALVAAATAAGADAVHPGYGFLAESPEFAEAVARARLVFVGPPPAALRAAGDKIEARRLAEAAGIPVTPGYAGVDLADETLEQEALLLGFPLMVKAAAGGGGRGMRTVLAAPALPDAIAAARREAAAAFGDGRVYLERLVARPGTSRCRCSPTRTAPWSIWASGTARSSAATRRSSRKRRRRRSTPGCGRRWAGRPSRSPARPGTSAPARSSSCSGPTAPGISSS